jgi:PKD repeat protein
MGFGRWQSGRRAVCGTHTYAAPGVYTATVTASNNSSSAQAQTVVTVVEAANINGRIWHDLDLDGRSWASAKAGLAGITVSAIGPTGTIQTTTDSDGRYQLFTPTPGLYTVSAAAPNMTPTSASPIPVPMGEDGGTVIDFGLHETPPAGFGIIAGRAWVDLDGSGFPEPDEEPLAGLQLDYYGWQYPQQTITTDANGLFSLLLPHERGYVLTMVAPGFFPPERRLGGFNIWLDQDDPLLNVHSPFARGGTVSGRVSNSSGAGVPNASLNIAQPINVTSTDANGDYAFIEQDAEREQRVRNAAALPIRQLQRRWFPRLSPAAQQLCHGKLAGGAHRPSHHPRRTNHRQPKLAGGEHLLPLAGQRRGSTHGHRAERPDMGRPGRRDVYHHRPARIPAARYHRVPHFTHRRRHQQHLWQHHVQRHPGAIAGGGL